MPGKTSYDASIMRDAFIKGSSEFKTFRARFEDEFTGELQRNMVYIMWQRAPDEIKQQIKATNPEAYKWIEKTTSEMTEE